MGNTSSIESPLEAAAGAAGPRATEAFAILGHETRLAILLALWEAYEPYAAENAVSFSELRKRVGVPDGSQFNYHLTQLVGHFVRKTADGYELRQAGYQLVQSIIAGTGLEDPSVGATEIDRDCHLCGAPTAVTYHDEWLFLVCTECSGAFGNRESQEHPDGYLAGLEFDPAGIPDRRPAEMYEAAKIKFGSGLQAAIDGVCSACSGPMDGWLDVCEVHASEGVCPKCERRGAVIARFRCAVCKQHYQTPPKGVVGYHPSVVAFAYDHDITLIHDDVDVEDRHVMSAPDPALEITEELIAEEPPRVRVMFEYEDDELQATLDEDVNVIDVTEKD